MSSTTSNALDERQIALLQASSRGLENQVRQLLTGTAWTSHTDAAALRRSLQHVAARGNLSLARYLIESGADINPEGAEVGALIKAAATGKAPLLKLMLEAPAQRVIIDTRDKAGRTALYAAAWAGNVEAAKLLLERKANVDARDREGRTPLIHLAADKPGKWKPDMIKLLLASGADIEALDNTRRTALLWAASTGKTEMCHVLLSGTSGKIADVKATNNRGKTPLQLAAESNHELIVAMLLAAGADPQATSDGGWTALHNAAEKGHTAIVRLLLNTNADVNAETSSGMTALHWAAQNGHEEVVSLIILKPEVMLSNKDTFNSTPLLRAAERGHMEIVQMLSPYQQAHRLPEIAQRACKGFETTIVDFGIEASHRNPDHRKGQLVYKHSVYDLLYGWDHKQHAPLVQTLPKNVKSRPAFRWIHLPANNVAWIETLLTKSFIEGGARDVDDFKALEKCFGQEHRGPTVHAQFMRTFCQRMGTSIVGGNNNGPVDAPGPPAPPLEGHATAIPQQAPEPDPANSGPSPAAAGTPVKEPKKKGKKEKQQGKEATSKGDTKGNGGRGGKPSKPPSDPRSDDRQAGLKHGKTVLFVSLSLHALTPSLPDVADAVSTLRN
jgi:ankyrin repeat protein